MKKIIPIALFMVLLTNVGCLKQGPSVDVPEIRPGILKGYLEKGDYPDSLALVPPPPESDSAGFALDESVNKKALAMQGTERFKLAHNDADLSFPVVANTFSCALGIPISEVETPHLYMLLRRTLADVGLATYAAKDHYQRKRPFVFNGLATCTPDEEEHLSHDGSYPSGHTAVGWGLALVLTQVSPERTDAILARGRAFGESRLVCNVHWYSDVLSGRMVAAATVARLNSNKDFLTAVEAARREVGDARSKGLVPVVDCSAEKRALEQPVSLQ